MAVQQLGGIAEIEGWETSGQKSTLQKILSGIWTFCRRKPLGAICGFIVIFFMIIGDLVPETLNKAFKTPVIIPLSHVTVKPDMGKPIPYLADKLEAHTSFIYPYAKQDLRARLQGPSSKHWLGTDSIGRDILSRLVYGARTAVMVSFGAVFISQGLAAVIGIMSGYYGGKVDMLAYRIVDVFQALPGLVVLITILGIFGSGLWQLIFVIGVVGGPIASRVVRSQPVHRGCARAGRQRQAHHDALRPPQHLPPHRPRSNPAARLRRAAGSITKLPRLRPPAAIPELGPDAQPGGSRVHAHPARPGHLPRTGNRSAGLLVQ